MSQQPSAPRRIFTLASLRRTSPVLLAGAALLLAPTPWLLAQDPPHPAAPVAALPTAARLSARLFLGSELVARGTWATAGEHHRRALAADPGERLLLPRPG